ncbi:MAG: hypothetical protein QI223_00880 [Candidatus Korarchaeota archaeon]|nr:hypothetical protein [Candidatus Korarchaeota archaeon]
MEGPSLMDWLASLLEAGMPPLAAIESLARSQSELQGAAARAKVEGDVLTSLSLAAEAFGDDAPLVRALVPGLSPDGAAMILRHAASASRAIGQLMEERKSVLRWHRRVCRTLAASVAASTAVLGKVTDLLAQMSLGHGVQGTGALGPMVAIGLGFSALLLSETGDSPAWMALPAASAALSIALLEAMGV